MRRTSSHEAAVHALGRIETSEVNLSEAHESQPSPAQFERSDERGPTLSIERSQLCEAAGMVAAFMADPVDYRDRRSDKLEVPSEATVNDLFGRPRYGTVP